MIAYSTHHKQQGVVLVVSLIMLVLLTLIGVTSMRVTSLEEKMAGNAKSANLAFQVAESALREGENWLATQVSEPDIDSNQVWAWNALDPAPTDSVPWWFSRDAAWWTANTVRSFDLSTIDQFDDIKTDPFRVIEFRYFSSDTLLIGTNNTAPGINYYQVTAKGTGPTDQSRQLVQSTTARRF